jgi:hypothetical protein
MRRNSFVVLAGDDTEANNILAQLVAGTVAFFQRKDRANHKGVVDKTKAHNYPLWGTGYTHSFVGGKSRLGREQWHVVVGASDEEIPWPPEADVDDASGGVLLTNTSPLQCTCSTAVSLLEGVTIRGLDLLLPDGEIRTALADTRTEHGDSSVLDLFHYTAADGDYGMGDHTDPGLLTILPASSVPPPPPPSAHSHWSSSLTFALCNSALLVIHRVPWRAVCTSDCICI